MEEERKEEEENIVDKAERLSRELDEKIQKNAEILASIEREKADKLLSGTAGGGIPPKDKRMMTPEEYTRYVEKHGRAPEDEN